MATAFATPSTTTLRERTASPSIRVDTESAVIFGVKVIGSNSANGRFYPPATLRAAMQMYEGCAVGLDHGERGTADARPVGSRVGWLEHVREGAGGLVADLHLLKSHQLTPMLLEAASRRPELFGLSHDAEGRIVRRDGKNVVEEITRVRSVDVVTSPATTQSMFESENTMIAHYPIDAAEFAARLLESDGLPMADVVPPVGQADDLDADRELTALQKAAIDAIENAKSAADLAGKLRSILDARGDQAGPAAGVTPESYLPTDARGFAEAICEGYAGPGRTFRQRASAGMPNNAAEFVNALID